MAVSDPINFCETQGTPVNDQPPWKVLIIDDEKDVHTVTEMALQRFRYEGKPLKYLHAYSSSEARKILATHPDIAVVLLDVVMETDDAGLQLIKFIREELGNRLTRIILRTGQPGHAPEKEVITTYDINDYKSKTELTAQKLFTTMVTSIRSYKAEYELLDEKDKIRLTLQSITDGVITTDIIGRVTYMNDAAEYITGVTLTDAINNPVECICTLSDPTSRQKLDSPVIMSLRNKENIEMGNRVLLERHDGEKRIIGGSVALTHDQQNQITGTVVTFHDETLSRNMEKMLDWQQSHDPLTDLMNRREFEAHIRRILHSSTLSDTRSYLLYIDVNNFKLLNDSFGHIAGDSLLVNITYILTNMISEPNIVARIGSDEFGVILTQYDDEASAIEFANSIIERVENYHFAWSEQEFKTSVSIGMVPINSDCEGMSCVLSAANIACEAAKEEANGEVNYFAEQNSDLLQKMHELSWATRLSRSIQYGDFELWCQKIESLNGASQKNSHHYEILVRLRDEEKLLEPDNFIPAAEKYNLMPRLDRWIIESTIKSLSRWNSQNGDRPAASFSINLSGTSLSDPYLIGLIREAFDRYPFPAENICFEITETATISNMSKALKLIDAIKEIGCMFSLDDFGSGLSSFSYLRQLPVDYLKIDGQFIKDMHTDNINMSMVKAIHHIGRIMNMQTIAEYVENDEIINMLKEIGVDYGQGFAISKPQPFENLLRTI